jgi:putative redox protein
MDMKIRFPGNKRVDAVLNGFTIQTDQSQEEGGDGSAPEPFSLFLASIGTCAGIYVSSFCQQRGIPTEKLELNLSFEWNDSTHHMDAIRIHVDLPPDFPPKYQKAVIKAAAMCTVKRHLENPPAIEVTASIQESNL